MHVIYAQLVFDDIVWCNKWGLILSPTDNLHPERPPNLRIQNTNDCIEYVTYFKYLGMPIDTRFTFKKHFEDVTQRWQRRHNVLVYIWKGLGRGSPHSAPDIHFPNPSNPGL